MAVTIYGAFAEEVKTDARRLMPIPEEMDFVTASAFGLTYGTSDFALRDRGDLKAGETLLVLGAAGGVGIAAIEIGKAVGARVIACASTDDKLSVCRAHGADDTINYAREDLRARIKDLTSGNGVDVVYDPVGGPYTELALRSIAWRGRLLVVGFAAGEIPKIPLNLTLLKGCAIVGVFWGDYARREPERFAESIRQLDTLVCRRADPPAYLGDISTRARAGGARADGGTAGHGQDCADRWRCWVLRCQGAGMPGCQGAKVPGCWGARVPGC